MCTGARLIHLMHELAQIIEQRPMSHYENLHAHMRDRKCHEHVTSRHVRTEPMSPLVAFTVCVGDVTFH